MADLLSDTAALASRMGAAAYELRVVEAADLTPSMRRLRLAAAGLGDLRYEPGQDLMLSVPTHGGNSVSRRYTIRSLDRAAGIVTLDIVLHGSGPGARWVAGAGPGSEITAIGPRGKITLAQADWHLFVGDESFLPAAFAMTEALTAETAAVLVLEVDGPDDEQPLAAAVAGEGPTWVHRDGAAPGGAVRLLAALQALELPPGTGHAYIGGEFHAVAAVRAHLDGCGFTPERVSAKSYWRLGTANAAHGEPDRG